MATKTLRVQLADIVGPVGPTGAVSGEVWARYSSDVRLTDGTLVVMANRRQVPDAAGVVDFVVIPNDDVAVHADDRGFGVVVGWDLSYRGEHGQRVHLRETGKTVEVVSADPDVVPFALRAPFVPVIPGASYATTADISAAIAGKLDAATANSTYAPLLRARPGNRAVFLGDSITAGGDDEPNLYRGVSWPTYASVLSGQRIQYVHNAGVPGNTTAQMLARFDTDVTPYAPNVVTVLCGVNDLAATAFDTWAGQLRALVAKVAAIGAIPVLATLPPNNTTANHGAVTRFSGYVRKYATDNGLPLVDFYTLLVDPANGNYKAAYAGDGVHPNAAGTRAMGALVADTIAPLLPAAAPMQCSDDADPNNIVTGGCFTANTGTGVPAGWWDNAGTPAGSVISYTTDAAVPGKLLTVTSTASSGLRQFATPISDANFDPGDEMILTATVTSDGGVPVGVDIIFDGSPFRPSVKDLTGAITRGVLYYRFTTPTFTKGGMHLFRLWIDAGTNVVSFGRIGLYNATRLGI